MTWHERAAAALDPILVAIPPASGAVVMGTGIVSIALSLDKHETLSRILLVICALAWIFLGMLLAGRGLHDRGRVRREASSPAALTGVAGTAVLGTRLVMLGGNWAGIALLVTALAFRLTLLKPLAVLAATLAVAERADWLLYAALAPFVLGLAFYVFVISRFDLRQLLVGRGDHWITGGALAITTLAARKITLGAHALHHLTGLAGAPKTVSVVLWALTIAWLPVLLAVEALAPRLGYDAGRWSTVFPVGMCAACSFVVGAAAHATGITDFARVWVWAAVALWLVVFATMLRRGLKLLRGEHPAVTAAQVDEVAPSQRRGS